MTNKWASSILVTDTGHFGDKFRDRFDRFGHRYCLFRDIGFRYQQHKDVNYTKSVTDIQKFSSTFSHQYHDVINVVVAI